MGLNIAAGALSGANTVILPYVKQKMDAAAMLKNRQNQIKFSAVGKKMQEMDQYDLALGIANGEQTPTIKTFNPAIASHTAAWKFAHGETPDISDKDYADFMSTPTDLFKLPPDARARYDAATTQKEGDPEFGPIPPGTAELVQQHLGGNPEMLAQAQQLLGGQGGAAAAQPQAQPQAQQPSPQALASPSQAMPAPGVQTQAANGDFGQAISPEEAASAGVAGLPEGQGIAVQPGQTAQQVSQQIAQDTAPEISTLQNERESQGRAAMLGRAPLPTPLFRPSKSVAEKLYEMGYTVRQGGISRPGASFEKMNDVAASNALDKFTAGMPAVDATRGLGPAARKVFMEAAPDILRAQLAEQGWDDRRIESLVKHEFGSDKQSKTAQYRENQLFNTSQAGPRARAAESARRDVRVDKAITSDERGVAAAKQYSDDPKEQDAYLRARESLQNEDKARATGAGARKAVLDVPQTPVEAARATATTEAGSPEHPNVGAPQPGSPEFEQKVQKGVQASTVLDAKEANSYFDPKTGHRAKPGVSLASANETHVYLDDAQKKQYSSLRGAAAGLEVSKEMLKALPTTKNPGQNFLMRKLLGVTDPGKIDRFERAMASAGNFARAISTEVGAIRNEDIDRALKLFDPRQKWTTTSDVEQAIALTEKALAAAVTSLGMEPSSLGINTAPKIKSVGEALP